MDDHKKLVSVPEENQKHADPKAASKGLLRPISNSVSSTIQNSQDDGLKNLPKQIAISCSGCGFLGTYHFGVMMCFQRNGQELLSRVTRFAGTSAGSLISALMVLAPDTLDDGLQKMYDMADELNRLPLGALSSGFFLSERLATIVNCYLPDDVSPANNRLFISITRQKEKTNRIISQYHSRDYLARCLSASCFIPIYSSGYYAKPPTIDEEIYIDGGYTNNLPVFDDLPTITISPFSGSALIAPQDKNIFKWRMTLGAQSMKVNMQNIVRGAHSLFPPTSDVLHAYYEMGYRDGLKFLFTNGLLQRDEAFIAMGQSDREDDGLGIKPGEVISSVKSSFVVIKLLGSGGFGAVYKVHDQEDKKKMFAMKVEKKLEKRKHSKLKMEVAILKMVSETRSPENSHFTAIIDRGKKEKYFFLVMTLVGKSLDDLKHQRPNKVFSFGTGIGASIQCLESIEDLTKSGFIHRDIKPANYACGLGEKRHIIYLLDFGIARRILNEENELKTPRFQVGFKGTVRFASLSCHRSMEMGPKDDCESWFYLLLDLLVVGGLPWRKCSEKADVLKCKEECRKEKRDKLFHGLKKCSDTFGKILDYIDSLTYSDKVDYSFIYKLLRVAAAETNACLDSPYDWETDTTTNQTQPPSKASGHSK